MKQIPPAIIARADLLIAASLQTELIKAIAGLGDKLHTPETICALIKSVGTVAKLKRGKK